MSLLWCLATDSVKRAIANLLLFDCITQHEAPNGALVVAATRVGEWISFLPLDFEAAAMLVYSMRLTEGVNGATAEAIVMCAIDSGKPCNVSIFSA